jgi:hypothetical protein
MTPRRTVQVERHRRRDDQHKDRRDDQNPGKNFRGHFLHPFRFQDDTLSKKPQANFVPPGGKSRECEKGLELQAQGFLCSADYA